MARITNALRHTHQYFRMAETGLWYCSGIDGCTHYMPKNMPAPTGRMSICWGCEKKFQLTPANMIDDNPKCDDCAEKYSTVLSDERIERMMAEKRKKPQVIEVEEEQDEIEVEDTHSAECETYVGGSCTCK